MHRGEILRLRREDPNFSGKIISRMIRSEIWQVPPGWLLIEQRSNRMVTGLFDNRDSAERAYQTAAGRALAAPQRPQDGFLPSQPGGAAPLIR